MVYNIRCSPVLHNVCPDASDAPIQPREKWALFQSSSDGAPSRTQEQAAQSLKRPSHTHTTFIVVFWSTVATDLPTGTSTYHFRGGHTHSPTALTCDLRSTSNQPPLSHWRRGYRKYNRNTAPPHDVHRYTQTAHGLPLIRSYPIYIPRGEACLRRTRRCALCALTCDLRTEKQGVFS